MTAIVPSPTPPALSGASAMIPRTMRDAMDLAAMLAKTGFLPRQIQTPGGALFVVEQAMRWNMSPFAVATEMAFIGDKPMFSGKLVAAAVQSSGVLQGRLSYSYSGEGDSRAVTVSGTLRGETTPRTVTVRLADVRTANKVWTTQPDQQLAYHGARVWARRHAPEVMLGVYSPEEVEEAADIPIMPREVPNLAVVEEAPQPAVVEDAPQPAVVEEDMLPILAPDGSLKGVPARSWLAAVDKALAMMEDAAAVRAWSREMAPHIDSIRKLYARLAAAAERRIAERLDDPATDRVAGDDR